MSRTWWAAIGCALALTGAAPLARAAIPLPYVSAGMQHTLAIRSDGTLWAWGDNQYGRLGTGSETSSSLPLHVGTLTGVVHAAAGVNHSLAATSDGKVWAWGLNTFGQVGAATPDVCGEFEDPCALQPVQVGAGVAGFTNIVAVAVGFDHSLALKSDGTVWAWGSGSGGKLGNGSTSSSALPVRVLGPDVQPSLTGVTAIAAGYSSSFALKSDGTVWSWGSNVRGDLGNNGELFDSERRPVKVAFPNDPTVPPVIVALSHGLGAHGMALDNAGNVWTWGLNSYGQIGDGTDGFGEPFDKYSPVKVLGGVTGITAGSNFSLAVKQDGTVWAWGLNNTGQLGVSGSDALSCGSQDSACFRLPVQAGAYSDIGRVAAGGAHSFALTASNVLHAWGNNFVGQLGNQGGSFGASTFDHIDFDPDFVITPAVFAGSQTSIGTASSSGGVPLDALLSAYDLGVQPVGVQSPPKTIVFSNATFGPVAIQNISTSAEYARSHNCGPSVASGGSCSINVTFTPAASGARAGTLTVQTDSASTSASVALRGAGAAPFASLTATSVAFGNQALGSTSGVQPVTVTNTGSATLNIVSMTLTGTHAAQFQRTGTCGATLGAGLTCQIDLRFAPALPPGAKSAQLSIATDAPGSPHLIDLSGNAVDATAPSVPGDVSAAASESQINLSWSASTDNVSVTLYQVFRDGVFRATVNAPAASFGDTGLAPSSTYNYTVRACDGAGNCSAQSAAAAAATPASGLTYTPILEPGFNLIGNSLEITLDVAATFGSQGAPVPGVTEKVISVWKWNAAAGKWAFHSPQLTAVGNTAYAASRNYDLLSTINPGEGYWVNAVEAVTLPAQTGNSFGWSFLNFSALPSGFNLISSASDAAPSQFNAQVSATPPAPGAIPTENFVSLWVWDAVFGKWYFYSPILEASGGLPAVKAYAESYNYLHFQDPPAKTLGVGTGFWVNRP